MVVVVGVDRRKALCQLRGLLWDIGGRAEAHEQHVYLVLVLFDICSREHAGLSVQRIATGENTDEFHIRLVGNDLFDAAAQVAVADDGGTNHEGEPFLCGCTSVFKFLDFKLQTIPYISQRALATPNSAVEG